MTTTRQVTTGVTYKNTNYVENTSIVFMYQILISDMLVSSAIFILNERESVYTVDGYATSQHEFRNWIAKVWNVKGNES